MKLQNIEQKATRSHSFWLIGEGLKNLIKITIKVWTQLKTAILVGSFLRVFGEYLK